MSSWAGRPLPVEADPDFDVGRVMRIEPVTKFLSTEKVRCFHAA
jgi:hypothetical protein